MLRVGNAITEIARTNFQRMLRKGAFPEIKWEETESFKTYSLYEYTMIWARYMAVLNALIKKSGEELGIFTRRRTLGFLNTVSILARGITEEDILSSPERFKTFMD